MQKHERGEKQKQQQENNLLNIVSVEVFTALASIDTSTFRIHAIVPELEPGDDAGASSSSGTQLPGISKTSSSCGNSLNKLAPQTTTTAAAPASLDTPSHSRASCSSTTTWVQHQRSMEQQCHSALRGAPVPAASPSSSSSSSSASPCFFSFLSDSAPTLPDPQTPRFLPLVPCVLPRPSRVCD